VVVSWRRSKTVSIDVFETCGGTFLRMSLELEPQIFLSLTKKG
jgi:hypothetical protein